ncbi:MAG: HEAT repeat domain-containing protein [Planctomycetes bacterium]|nr:HEAT repeat domain-containing protein [Planctomycetota bacterium]
MQRLPRTSFVLFVMIPLGACASTAAKKDADKDKALPYDPKWSQPDAPEPIGKLLATVDMSLRAWTKLVLSAESEEERRQARGLELDVMRRVRPRVAELIHELENGAPSNRVPAAAALGFTHAPEAQSPLLNALHDPRADVVSNALIGLAILQMADTPLAPIVELFAHHTDGFVRSNAAWALRSLIEAGADGSSAVESARTALSDSEPFVRAQAALILAGQKDTTSIAAIGELTRESAPFVVLASSEALAQLGRDDLHFKGAAARELARAFEGSDKKLRGILQRALIELSGENHGDDPNDWLEWAAKLP